MTPGLPIARPPHPHIKRALAAMGDMRVLEADHKRAKFRQAQPLRHLAAAARRARRRRRGPLPVITSTSRASRACALRRNRNNARVRLALRQPMQIEPGVDRPACRAQRAASCGG